MPITKSAKKALRQSLKRHRGNLVVKKAMRNAEKAFKKAIEQKNKEDAAKLLSLVAKTFDKAVKKGVIKKNTASRKKSRSARQVSKI
ncbi:30S ribosomal protein S20 [Patescibacteria group bacterium]